jgi:hypothetical protein
LTFAYLSLILLVYLLACLGAGGIVFWIFSRQQLRPTLTQLAGIYLLGLGILGNNWLLMALLEGFDPLAVKIIILILASIGTGYGYKSFSMVAAGILATFKEALQYRAGWLTIVLLTTLSALLWMTSLGRAPWGDGTAFYLAIAKVTTDSHRLAPLPGYEEFTSIGLQGEMHYAALMSLGSPGAAQLFSWPTMLAAAVMLVSIAREAGLEHRGQWLVLAILLTSSAVVEISGSGKTDLFAVALGFAAYYWALQIRHNSKPYVFWLTGLFGGLALIAKVSYLLTFVPSICLIIAWSYTFDATGDNTSKLRLKSMLFHLFLGMFGALIAIVPHLIKNYVLFENPLAPLEIGGTGFQDQTWYGPATTRQILLSLPLALTFGDYWAQIGNLSPLVLAFCPLLFIIPRPSHLLKSTLFMITASAIFGLAFWFILRPSVLAPRYFMTCLLLLALPAARAAEHVSHPERHAGILHTMVVIVTTTTLILNGLYSMGSAFFPRETISYLFGKDSICERDPDRCWLAEINDTVEPGKRLFTNTFLRYWLRSDLIQCALTSDEADAYLDLETPQQRWEFMYGRGFEYIPIFGGQDVQGMPLQSRLEPTPKWVILENQVLADLQEMPGWLEVKKVNKAGHDLLKLTSKDPSHRPLIGCRQVSPPAWDLFNLENSPVWSTS